MDDDRGLDDEERAELERLRAERDARERGRAERVELERLRREQEAADAAREEAERIARAKARGRDIMEPGEDLRMPRGQKVVIATVAIVAIVLLLMTFLG